MEQIGVVSNYFANIGVAAVKLSGALKVGDKIKIVGGGSEVEVDVGSMQMQHERVDEAEKGDEVGIKIPEKVHKGNKVFRA